MNKFHELDGALYEFFFSFFPIKCMTTATRVNTTDIIVKKTASAVISSFQIEFKYYLVSILNLFCVITLQFLFLAQHYRKTDLIELY